jgi:hypothetical protein
MSEIICTGLDGTNPLHVLAALGLLQIGHAVDGSTTLHWRRGQTWSPVLSSTDKLLFEPGTITQALKRMATAGERDTIQETRLRALNAERKKLLDQGKKERAAAKESAKQLPPDERKQALQIFEEGLDRSLSVIDHGITAAQELVNDALGAGVAHLGDVIGVAPGIFRRKAEQASRCWIDGLLLGESVDAGLIADAMASQACDAVLDGKGVVQNTPLSFSNGASGQCLLKAFRTLAGIVTAEQVTGTLVGNATRYLPGETPLNWDPADQRDYALAWASPEDKQLNPKQTDVAANALALIGLSLLTACPIGNHLEPVAWKQRGPAQGFSWPLWEMPLSAPVVRSLLVSVPYNDEDRRAMGIASVLTAARINPTGKRNFFAPARPT